MIRFDGITHDYGRKSVLRGVSATVRKGTYTTLVGPNGSGKSTLLSILCGFLRPTSGTIHIDGQTLSKMRMKQRATCFAVIRQGEQCAMPYTCLEMILMGLSPYMPRLGSYGAQEIDSVQALMDETDTRALAHRPVTEISGGELQRVLLCRALAQRPRLLFLDEAMSDLDVRARLSLVQLLKEKVATQGLTVLSIHHDLQTAYHAADEVLVLCDGRFHAQGSPQSALTPALFHEVFGVEAEIVPGKGPFFRRAVDT